MIESDTSSSFLHKHMFLIAMIIGVLAVIIGLFFTKKTFAPGNEAVPYENVDTGVMQP